MTKRQADDQRRKLVQTIVSGFTYDPGHSDLDDEQPIHVRMTLGDYRAACRLGTQAESEPGPEPGQLTDDGRCHAYSEYSRTGGCELPKGHEGHHRGGIST